MKHDVDFLVLGAGSAGVRASRVAASLGASVAVVEERFLGGTCVNVGCVPKKLMAYGSHFADELAEARGYGWDVGPASHDWRRFIAHKDREIARLNKVYERLLVDSGVRIVRGRGTFEDAHTVRVDGPDGPATLRAEHILVATGGAPVPLPVPGHEHALVSDDLFALPARPQRLVVVGAGYIGVEFAGIFHGFGSEVTLVHRGRRLLRGFDHDVRAHLEAEYRKRGIRLRFATEVTKLHRRDDGAVAVHLTSPVKGHEVEVADAVLAAIGRRPSTAGLGLEAAGVRTDPRGAILVDRTLRTSAPSIYACGDVIERVQLTPVALAEGMMVARRLFGQKASAEPSGHAPRDEVDYATIPSAVFSQPPVGTIGLTEQQARMEVGAVDVYRSTFKPMKLTMTGSEERALMKIVVERATDRVVGIHVVGPDAGEIVQGFAVALRLGAKKADLDATIGIHPTAAEELVTMRVALPEPDHEELLRHVEEPAHKSIVHSRWDVEV